MVSNWSTIKVDLIVGDDLLDLRTKLHHLNLTGQYPNQLFFQTFLLINWPGFLFQPVN